MSETQARYHVRSKYGNRRVAEDGYMFDSLRELRRYRELRLLLAAGEISGLEVHPVFELAPGVTLDGRKRPPLRYRADFAYHERDDGRLVVEDVKGGSATKTEAYRLRRHLLMAVHGICVREVER